MSEQIIKDTRIFTTTVNGVVVIAKGRVCYNLVEYDVTTKVGMIFLCTLTQAKADRYLMVGGGYCYSNGKPLGIYRLGLNMLAMSGSSIESNNDEELIVKQPPLSSLYILEDNVAFYAC